MKMCKPVEFLFEVQGFTISKDLLWNLQRMKRNNSMFSMSQPLEAESRQPYLNVELN